MLLELEQARCARRGRHGDTVQNTTIKSLFSYRVRRLTLAEGPPAPQLERNLKHCTPPPPETALRLPLALQPPCGPSTVFAVPCCPTAKMVLYHARFTYYCCTASMTNLKEPSPLFLPPYPTRLVSGYSLPSSHVCKAS